MLRRRTALLLCAAALAATAVSCSGGDDDDAGGTPAPASATAPAATPTRPAPTAKAPASPTKAASATASASPAATATSTAGPGAGSRPGAEGRKALLNSLLKLESSDYHVVYRIAFDEEDEPFEGTFAFAAKGEQKRLFLMTLESAEGAFIIATVNDGETSYFCIGGDDPDNPGEISASCFESDDDDPLGDDLPFLRFEDEIKRMATDGEAFVRRVDDRRVGGHEANCYEVTDSEGAGVVCVAKADGFLLLIDGAFEGGSVHMEAETYTDNPADSVFEPPYPVEEFGAAG